MPKLTDRDLQMIQAMADFDLRVTDVARKMHFHRNTVLYHLGQVRKKDGAGSQEVLGPVYPDPIDGSKRKGARRMIADKDRSYYIGAGEPGVFSF